MLFVTTLLLAAAALPLQQEPEQLAPSPVARVIVTPAAPVLTPGESVRLTAEAVNSQGAAVADAAISFVRGGGRHGGGRYEGTVDSTGVVTGGSPGTVVVSVVATVPGSRPVIERVEVRIVPGPATHIEIEPLPTKLVSGQQVFLHATVYSAGGYERDDAVAWSSSDRSVATVNDHGVVGAVSPGRASIRASMGDVSASFDFAVVEAPASLAITPTSVTARRGDVIRFQARAIDSSGRAIEDLAPHWSFAPGEGIIDTDGAFVGYAAGNYVVTASLGNLAAEAAVTLSPRDVRRPAQIVGRLPRTAFTTEEVWVHPNGRVAYLGTGSGGDRMYAIDISDPSHPVVSDSIVVDTRRVNDIMTTPDGRFLVFTREQASSRRNGIVIASLKDPLHPVPIAEFTDGVTAGVHSAFVYHQEQYGTHVYLTNDGTGAMHVIDIGDPYNPVEVAQWRTDRPDAARSLHDVDVKDGLAYLSYWNDGLVILDVGNGIRGGSPANPQLVTQYKYNLDELYRDVEARAGPGFIRGTHTAWRHEDYVFLADEVFPAAPPDGAKDASAVRVFGMLHVLDVSDIENPRSVAWYEPEFGGVHNVWVAGDTLYLGAYNGGFHAFDISGELRGDLRAQSREILHVNTADMDGNVPNVAMTWGVVVKNDLAYVNDMYNGLWIIRMKEPRRELTP